MPKSGVLSRRARCSSSSNRGTTELMPRRRGDAKGATFRRNVPPFASPRLRGISYVSYFVNETNVSPSLIPGGVTPPFTFSLTHAAALLLLFFFAPLFLTHTHLTRPLLRWGRGGRRRKLTSWICVLTSASFAPTAPTREEGVVYYSVIRIIEESFRREGRRWGPAPAGRPPARRLT